MYHALAWTTLALPLALVSCSWDLNHGKTTRPASPPSDPRIRVTGLITNEIIISRQLLWVTLFVTNVTEHDLYVPRHFNSKNYSFATGTSVSGSHVDSWGARFKDFVRLKPNEATNFTTCFRLGDRAGDGVFSVDFYNNMLPEVERGLEETGVPYVRELYYNFGRVPIISTNESAASGIQPIRSGTNLRSRAGSRP